jgi:hypothetical protein
MEEKRIYVSLYNEDNFEGLAVTPELLPVIEYLEQVSDDEVIDQIFEDWTQYHSYEVECASYAKDGSAGTQEILSIDGLIKYFYYDEDIQKYLKNYVENNGK